MRNWLTVRYRALRAAYTVYRWSINLHLTHMTWEQMYNRSVDNRINELLKEEGTDVDNYRVTIH